MRLCWSKPAGSTRWRAGLTTEPAVRRKSIKDFRHGRSLSGHDVDARTSPVHDELYDYPYRPLGSEPPRHVLMIACQILRRDRAAKTVARLQSLPIRSNPGAEVLGQADTLGKQQ